MPKPNEPSQPSPPLPLSATQLLTLIATPAAQWCEAKAGIPASLPALRLMVAIAMQESGCTVRTQAADGPACGFWQFEAGGVRGVLEHKLTDATAVAACEVMAVEPVVANVHLALRLPACDWLAAVFARLLIWTDPHILPIVASDAWDCYKRLWRPGKPRAIDWPFAWIEANDALHAAVLASFDDEGSLTI